MQPEYTITYRVPTAMGKLTPVRTYQCKDAEDYRRCYNLHCAGKIKLLTVNNKPVK